MYAQSRHNTAVREIAKPSNHVSIITDLFTASLACDPHLLRLLHDQGRRVYQKLSMPCSTLTNQLAAIYQIHTGSRKKKPQLLSYMC